MHYDIQDCNDKNGNKNERIVDKLLLSGDRRVLEYTMTFISALITNAWVEAIFFKNLILLRHLQEY